MLFLSLLTLVSVSRAEPSELVSDIVFITWDVERPTVTIMVDFDADSMVWNRSILLVGERVEKDAGWHFNVPSGLNANFDEIVVSPEKLEAFAITNFVGARVTIPVLPTNFDMSESRYYPGTSGRGGSHYIYLSNFTTCDGPACNDPKPLPRRKPSP